MKRLALLLLLAGCNYAPAAPAARYWPSADFLEYQGEQRNFGGFWPSELARPVGAPLRFQPGTQANAPGLTLFPGIADGVNVAFAITDIWQNYPQPWVQPVWIPRDQNGDKVDGVINVFPVDTDSTFYSPFWRAEFLLTPGLTPSTFHTAHDVLSTNKYERRSGAIILCPIVDEDGMLFADDGSGPKDPVTQRPLGNTLPSANSHAWYETDEQVTYIDFGIDRVQADGQNLIESKGYFFVARAGERPLPIAAILPSDPKRHSFVRRVDVVIPSGAAVFVPMNRPELRALLAERDYAVPDVPAALDAFPQYALRVATDPACFTDPSFPTACNWLDTVEKVEALPQKIVQPVQFSMGAAVAP